MGIKHYVQEGIESIADSVEDGIDNVTAKANVKLRAYDGRHPRPNAIDYTVTGVLGGVVAASEVAAHKLGAKPKTIPRVVAQVGLHGLAAGTTFVAGMLHESAAAAGAKK